MKGTLTNYSGIYLSGRYNVTIKNMNINNFGHGIYLKNSAYNCICGCNITNNKGVIANNEKNGIVFCNGGGANVYENTIAENDNGTALSHYSGALFYHNHFINNRKKQVVIGPGVTNIQWDNGYPRGGNYWSDYKGVDRFSGPYQNETGSDGIGDTPYIIDEYNVDRYPLMKPWKPIKGDINEDGIVNIYDVILVASIYGVKEGQPRWNPKADLAPPWGIINIYDIVTVTADYGKRR